MTPSDLAARLPASLEGRIASLTIREGRALAVLDVAGMTATERSEAEAAVRGALAAEPGIEAIHVVQTAERRSRPIIAVGSGKGGVGKSTLTANLAVALARIGRRVGLVDADIYGPSQPLLLGNADARPEAGADKKLIALPSAHGVSVLSMGHLVKPGQAIAWRGPMTGGALGQLIDADWGDAELLLVDLPPGTGDVQLTMLQKFKPAGAVLVSTPQDLALIDAARAGHLFEQAGVPIIGLVENMAGYACPHCGGVSDPFGSGGAEAAAERLAIPFLGRVPLAMAIRSASDAGIPPAAGDGAEAAPFHEIAGKLAAWISAQG